MTRKRTGDPWRSAADYGRSLPPFSVDLLVREIDHSLRFYTEVLGATVHYSDADFAALNLAGVELMLHADHAFDGHALYPRVTAAPVRGAGAQLRVLGVDPDAVERRALAQGAEVIQPAGDRGHGWRDVMVADPDGYVWAVGVPIG